MKNTVLELLKKNRPLLVASLDGDDLPYLLEEARNERADIVEIRLDLWGAFFRDEMLEKMTRFREKIGIPMLVSFRGGHPLLAWWQPVHWRALSQAALIDVEWNPKYPWKEILKNVRQYNLGLIISHHDYQETPSAPKLQKIVRAAYGKKADIVKIATKTKNDADVRTLLELCAKFTPKKLMTVMGMGGGSGMLSRLAAPLFGSSLVYGYIGTPTASGQLPFKELLERIRAHYPHYDELFQARQAKSMIMRPI